MKKPLEGIKVLDLSTYVAGPGTAAVLADWGADVIKIEGPKPEEGRKTGISVGCPIDDGCNPYYGSVNVGKRAISLNLKTEKGKEIMGQLLETADVFVTNIRSRALVRLGLDWETVHAKYPKLIFAHAQGFGENGPQKDDAGYDTVAFWAKTGLMTDLGEGDPLVPVWGFADGFTNPILAGGIAAALFGRSVTGEGSKVMCSLYSLGVYGLHTAVASTQYGDKFPRSRKTPSSPMANTYKCSDGEWIMISNFDDRLYPVFLDKIVGRPDLAADPAYNTQAAYPEKDGVVVPLADEAFAKKTSTEMAELLKENDIAFNILGHFKDIAHDPQAIENNYVVPYTHRDGSVSMMSKPPVKFDDYTVNEILPYPLFAEHTEEVLGEIGITDQDEVKKLAEEGVIVVR